jgi:hypothetical protein
VVLHTEASFRHLNAEIAHLGPGCPVADAPNRCLPARGEIAQKQSVFTASRSTSSLVNHRQNASCEKP